MRLLCIVGAAADPDPSLADQLAFVEAMAGAAGATEPVLVVLDAAIAAPAGWKRLVLRDPASGRGAAGRQERLAAALKSHLPVDFRPDLCIAPICADLVHAVFPRAPVLGFPAAGLEAGQRESGDPIERRLRVMERTLREVQAHMAAQREAAFTRLEAQAAQEARRAEAAIVRAEAYRQEMERMRRTVSWRITAPLRAVRGDPRGAARALWAKLPLAARHRSKVERWAAGLSPRLAAWARGGAGAQVRARAELALRPPAEIATAPPPAAPPARAIAFYLPQFHPIPENDRWWGAGFTEWANVVAATPQFVGHYQPHLPADLGFYDLRLVDVQRRQIELAKLYGLYGFCFYFYWFAGKRLLETPLLNWLGERTLDFPFCLCWANENWSRRWDGLDADILIAQEHSASDDLAFIAYAAKYLRDPRYIRIEGKPLLLVYRPSLLPYAKETAERWRAWCREHGVGEIYLAYTQSFEAVDPRQYGFDGAVEFPPNNSGPPDITDTVERINPSFEGRVY
ncbi:MAG: glycoside hydrolase family 99-like domain-containing protein, partial [Hyphomonadaceae bacterium]